jgi:hypothetical protein
MTYLDWNSAYESGIASIDYDHRWCRPTLLICANSLGSVCMAAKSHS